MSGAIVVNARSIHHPLTGVGRYTREVTAHLGDLVKLISSEKAAQGFPGHFWEQVVLPRELDRTQLLWSPANTGPLTYTRQVLTIHDISPLDEPDGFKFQFKIWYRVLLPLLVKQVRKVITDSEFSRRRIIEQLGVPTEKVVTIPCGVDRDHFFPRAVAETADVKSRYGLPENYLLTVGTLEHRKNYRRLFRAWQRINQEVGEISLVVVGRPGRAFRRMRFDPIPERVMFVSFVSEQDLPSLYSGALALVIPSLYEGFGMPAVEAMACGIPVIASRAGALPEVIGDAGRLVDPYNEEDITQAISQMIADPALREDFSARGLARAQTFSWDRTSAQIETVLEQVSSGT
jgi:glycosyltransferase involved in cell wall biosynthesis